MLVLQISNVLQAKASYVFDIDELITECNTDSCCEQIASGVNITY